MTNGLKLHHLGPGGEETVCDLKVVNKRMAGNLPSLVKAVNVQIQEANKLQIG